MQPIAIVLALILTALIAFFTGYAYSMKYYIKRAKEGNAFELNGRIYIIQPVEITTPPQVIGVRKRHE